MNVKYFFYRNWYGIIFLIFFPRFVCTITRLNISIFALVHQPSSFDSVFQHRFTKLYEIFTVYNNPHPLCLTLRSFVIWNVCETDEHSEQGVMVIIVKNANRKTSWSTRDPPPVKYPYFRIPLTHNGGIWYVQPIFKKIILRTYASWRIRNITWLLYLLLIVINEC